MVLAAKNLPVTTGDVRELGSIPGSGRSPGKGNGNSLQYPCLGKSMDRGAWEAIVHVSQRVGNDGAHTFTGRSSLRLNFYSFSTIA